MSAEELDDNQKINVGKKGENEFTTLGELAGISLDDVKEQRGFTFPKGDFVWEGSTDPENLPRLGVVGEGDKARAAIIIPLKCIDVIRVTDPEFTDNEAEIIGKIFRETFFLNGDLALALGYFKAFAKDTGTEYSSDIKTLITNMSGVRFSAPITKRKDKDDTDKVYTGLNRQKIKPYAAAEGSAIAAAVG